MHKSHDDRKYPGPTHRVVRTRKFVANLSAEEALRIQLFESKCGFVQAQIHEAQAKLEHEQTRIWSDLDEKYHMIGKDGLVDNGQIFEVITKTEEI